MTLKASNVSNSFHVVFTGGTHKGGPADSLVTLKEDFDHKNHEEPCVAVAGPRDEHSKILLRMVSLNAPNFEAQLVHALMKAAADAAFKAGLAKGQKAGGDMFRPLPYDARFE